MNDESDKETIAKIRHGDKEAYQVIVNRYMKKAYYTALGFVENSDDARDLSQEAFVRAYKVLATFDITKPFFPWYYKILRNICLNYKRKKRKSREVPIEAVHSDATNFSEDYTLNLEVWNAISKLGINEKEVILLKYFQGLSYKEISTQLGCPIGTVMSRLYYAKKQLREILKVAGSYKE